MENSLHAFRDPFATPGHWYRGNLHTHTTVSDGLKSPRQVAAWYRRHGYDMLAITDHDRRVEVEGLNEPGFLVLPGLEAHPDRPELDECYHLVALGVGGSHRFGPTHSAQEAIDELRADGALVFLAHPYWSGLVLREMMALEGLAGLEVSNATCAAFCKGVSAVHWDDLLARGRTLWGLATDDAHWHRPDYGQGWVMVKAAELAREVILEALACGCFYASQGPEIHDFQVTSSEVYVRCSPASTINCVSLLGTGMRAEARSQRKLLTEATFPRRSMQRYVRVECVDARGRTAWTPPVPL